MRLHLGFIDLHCVMCNNNSIPCIAFEIMPKCFCAIMVTSLQPGMANCFKPAHHPLPLVPSSTPIYPPTFSGLLWRSQQAQNQVHCILQRCETLLTALRPNIWQPCYALMFKASIPPKLPSLQTGLQN